MTGPAPERSRRLGGVPRRAFLFLMLGVVALLGGFWLFSRLRRGPLEAVVAILGTNLAELRIEEDELRRFAAAFVPTLTGFERSLLVGLTGLALPSGRSLLGRRPPPDPLREFEDRVVGSFLLSTDFFRDGGAQPPRFTRLYDPYTMACHNPFARLD